MTPTEMIMDLQDIFMPELFEDKYANKLTRLKGILQFSDVLYMGFSTWDSNLEREDRIFKDTVGISGYSSWFGRTKLKDKIGNYNNFITNAEFRLFTEPARAAIWCFSIPKGLRSYPELLTFSIFEVY